MLLDSLLSSPGWSVSCRRPALSVGPGRYQPWRWPPSSTGGLSFFASRSLKRRIPSRTLSWGTSWLQRGPISQSETIVTRKLLTVHMSNQNHIHIVWGKPTCLPKNVIDVMVTLGNTIMVDDLDDRSGNPSGPSWRWDPLQGGGLQHRCLQQIRL